MSEQSKIDAERAAFEAAYAEAVDSGWTSTKSLAQTIWQKARSLAVGVPDGEWILHMLADRWPDDGELVEVEAFRNWLDEALTSPSAPTVKAEQVQCDPAAGREGAGSAVEEVEVVGYRFFHVDHGYIFRSTHIYEGNPSLEAHSLMTVAQHKRIVAALSAQLRDANNLADQWAEKNAALSAQQSAHVSVPECKLGIRGRAYDAPSVCRAYTYTEQPNNDHAWKLGKAASAVKAGGDYIDAGLSLLEQLQANGFGVFELRALLNGGGA